MPIKKPKNVIKYYNMLMELLTQINANSISWRGFAEIRWAYAWER